MRAHESLWERMTVAESEWEFQAIRDWDESCREFKLSLSFGLKLSCTLSDSYRLPGGLIEFEPAQTFLESRREFSLVWPALHWVMIVDESGSHESQLQLSSSFDPGLTLSTA